MTRTFAVTLHKGGVGKTTTAVNIAGVLAEQGNQVLLVDCDSQGDLSSVFLNDHEKLPYTVADIFADSDVLLEDIIQPTPFANLAIIPADRRLEAYEQTHAFKDFETASVLADALAEVSEQYDYIVIDTATRPHLTGYAALVAADVAVVPIEAAIFSFRGVASIRRELQLESDARSLNPALQIRYFTSKTKRRKTHEVSREELRNVLGDEALLETDIPDSAAIESAMARRKPINIHSKKGKPTEAYRALVAELIKVTYAKQPQQTAA